MPDVDQLYEASDADGDEALSSDEFLSLTQMMEKRMQALREEFFAVQAESALRPIRG